MNKVGRILRLKQHKSSSTINTVLQFLVREAYRNVPFYHRTWGAAGFRIDDFRGAQDLQMLPITTRVDLLAQGLPDRLARHVHPGHTVSRVTSGMSGANFEIHMNRSELAFRQFVLGKRMWHNSGRRLPLTVVQAGSWVPTTSKSEITVRRTVWGRVIHISRRLGLGEQIEAIAHSRPSILTGCPSSLEILACEMRRRSIDRIRPRIVIARGEILRPQVRELLADVFACKVTNYYSAEEIGLIAWQCPDAPEIMHVNRAACVLEILDSEGMPSLPGQEGTVVVTNLFNRTMPLIRYSLGDRSALLNSAPAECNCGPDVETILTPAGRTDDIVVLPDNKQISPRVIDDLVYIACVAEGMESRFCRSIRDYQIVQDTSTLIRVLFLADGAPPDKLVATFTEGIKSLHPDLHCALASVSDLEPEESGKRRRITSHVE